MTQRLKQTAFAALVLACVGAALLLFLPERDQSDDISATHDERVDAMPETAISSPAPVSETPSDTPTSKSTAGEWNTYHGDHSLRGVADAAFPEHLAVRWRLAAGAPVRQPPVAHDGKIFAVNARGEIIAATPQGELVWRRELAADKKTDADRPARFRVEAPISAFHGKVFVGSDTGTLVALNAATGETVWRAQVGEVIRGAANYLPGSDSLVVLDQEEGAVYCLDARTGALRWRSERVDRSDGSPAVSGDLVVYGSCASALHVVSTETGERLRDIAIENGGGQVADGVALFEGFAYAGVRDGRMVRANLDTGDVAWSVEVSLDEVFCTPAVHGDRVLASSYDGFIHALRRDNGESLWRRELGHMPGSPVIVGDKVFVCADGTLHMLAFTDGTPLWKMTLADEIHGPAVLDNLLVVGSEDGVVIALGPADPDDK